MKSFRNIGHVHIEFGPGLNVLYGPNELGKSSLAEAIRAAFLVRPGSVAANSFIPWGTNLTPEVVVDFETKNGEADKLDDHVSDNETTDESTQAETGVTWRVTKEFSRGGKAKLQRLTASGGAIVEAEGRHVEGHLQELLEWGINPPGGRSGGRGMPSSYLTNALLGRQDQVETILRAELASDKHLSGREALTQALGALGQDPLVGGVLEKLEKELSPVFTESGQPRRQQDSPIVRMTEQVRAQDNVVQNIERQRDESANTRVRYEAAKSRQQELSDQCELLEETLTHWQVIQQTLEAVRTTHDQCLTVNRIQEELVNLHQHQDEAERQYANAKASCEECDESFAVAREQQTAAHTKLEHLGKSRDELKTASRNNLGARKSRCEQNLQQAKELRQLIATRSELERERGELSRELATKRASRDRSEKLVELSRTVERRTREQANASDFDNARELCRQSELDYQQHIDGLNRIKHELKAAESQREEEQVRLNQAKETLTKADHSSGSRAIDRANLENTLRKAQEEYRFVKQRADKQTLVEDRRRSVEDLREERSELESVIMSVEADELMSRSATTRWRICLGAATVVMIAGLALVLTSAELRTLGFVFCGIGAISSVATFVMSSQCAKAAQNSADERVRKSDARNAISNRLFLAESNLTLSEQEFESAANECIEFLSAEELTPEEGLQRVQAAKSELAQFDNQPNSELVSFRTSEVDAAELELSKTAKRIASLKRGQETQQIKVDESHAAFIKAKTGAESLSRLSDDELIGLKNQIDSRLAELELSDESQVPDSENAAQTLQASIKSVDEFDDKLRMVKAKLDDPSRELRKSDLVNKFEPVAQTVGEDVCEEFNNGPDDQSIARIIEHIEADMREINREVESTSEKVDQEIETAKTEVTASEQLVTKREKERQVALTQLAQADSKLNDLRGQCEVKQHELDKHLESGEPQQQLNEQVSQHNEVLCNWQRSFDGLDKSQLFFLEPVTLPREMRAIVLGQLLDTLQCNDDSQSLTSEETLEDSTASLGRVAESRVDSSDIETDMPIELHQSASRVLPRALGASENTVQAHIENRLLEVVNTVECLDRHLRATRRDATEAAKSMHTLEGELQKVAGPAIEEELAQAQEELERLQKHYEELQADYDAWKYLRELLTDVDAANSSHLGRQLAKPVQQAFLELTENRYSGLNLSPEMSVASIGAAGDARKSEEMSVGARYQLATLIRLTVAAQLQSVLVLDDQLAHSDSERMEWFRRRLLASSIDNNHQIVVITCRPEDYCDQSQSDNITVIDMTDVMRPIGMVVDSSP